MDKVTVTSAGELYLQQNFNSKPLPTIARHSSQPQQQNKTMMRQNSKGRLDVGSLRSILKDDTISEMNKLKEHTNTRAYLHVRQELMKDIITNTDFLTTKADNMARKMLSDSFSNQRLQSEIGKGKNYLSKLIGEHESQRDQEERIKLRLREKVRLVM